MKRMLVGALLGLSLHPLWTWAQIDNNRDPTALLHQVSPADRVIPDVRLTLTDCISTVSDFDIRHERPTPFTPRGLFGTTDFSSRTMYLFENYSLPLRLRTTIHEMIHVKLDRMGEDQLPEDLINDIELRIYMELFRR